jgi:hypothetical protein
MKIGILYGTSHMDYRFQHMVETLKLKHQVVIFPDITHVDNSFDVIFVEYYCIHTHISELCDRINSIKYTLLNFSGKLVFFNLDDAQATYTNELDEDIIHRIDAWVVYMIHREYLNVTSEKYKNNIQNKFVLIPRYTIPRINIEQNCYLKKKNNIVFVGRTTGNYWFNTKNFRIECLKEIWNNSFVSSHFDGWIVDDNIIDVSYQSQDYNDSFKFVMKDKFISEKSWLNMLNMNRLSLCIPGHTKLGYRHLQSMALKSTMVGNFNLKYDPYEYMFSDKLRGISYELPENIKNMGIGGDWPTMENFISICTEAIQNVEKSHEYADAAYDTYKQWFEVTKENTFQPHVWKIIQDNFSNLGIYDI